MFGSLIRKNVRKKNRSKEKKMKANKKNQFKIKK